jgi:hypothetical protein
VEESGEGKRRDYDWYGEEAIEGGVTYGEYLLLQPRSLGVESRDLCVLKGLSVPLMRCFHF